MSLLSTNIKQFKRLSLKGIKQAKSIATAPTEKAPLKSAVKVDRPPTEEEILYSQLNQENPAIEELATLFDAVSTKTGRPLRLVDLSEFETSQDSEPVRLSPAEIERLRELANKILSQANSYTREEIIQRLRDQTNVNEPRALRGFNLLVQSGAILPTPNPELFYLEGSTPF